MIVDYSDTPRYTTDIQAVLSKPRYRGSSADRHNPAVEPVARKGFDIGVVGESSDGLPEPVDLLFVDDDRVGLFGGNLFENCLFDEQSLPDCAPDVPNRAELGLDGGFEPTSCDLFPALVAVDVEDR